jgi:hypothetical protein
MRFPDLRSYLRDTSWATVGAAATRHYMPERLTNDLDILIHSNDEARVEDAIRASGARKAGALSIGGSSWTLSDGFHLDILVSNEPWVMAALEQASLNVDMQGLPVLPLGYLVLLKFRASRLQDVADMSRMLGQATADQLHEVRAVFQAWEPDGLEDVESLIALGQLEMKASE